MIKLPRLSIRAESTCLFGLSHLMFRRMLEEEDTDGAYSLYTQALQLYLECGKEAFAFDTFKNMVALLLRADRLLEAVEVLKKQATVHQKIQQVPQSFKCYLSVVIVLLKLGDYVAADRAYQEFLQCVC